MIYLSPVREYTGNDLATRKARTPCSRYAQLIPLECDGRYVMCIVLYQFRQIYGMYIRCIVLYQFSNVRINSNHFC